MIFHEATFGLAFLAGMASFLSPCVLSLVPIYIGYLGGQIVASGNVQFRVHRLNTFLHGVCFVLGFGLVFVGLGAAASAIGRLLFDLRDVLTRIGGVVVIIFGLHTMGVITVPFLYYDTRRPFAPAQKSLNFFSSALMGVFFSAGWSPCVGPVLGTMLTLALTTEGVNQGTALLSAYWLGLAIPFLAAALAIGQVTKFMRRLGKAMRYIEVATGVMLIIIGVLLFSQALSWLAIRFAQSPILMELQQALDTGVVAFWRQFVGSLSGS